MESLFLELLRKRRSIRHFQTRAVEPGKIDALIEAAVRSPTSRGRNPWEFIVVNDPKLLNKLGNAKQHGSAFLSDAPLAIVVAADKDKSDVWTEDCSIAAIIIQLAAEELGLGSCWVQIRLRPHDNELTAESFVKELLGMPDTHVVECIIGIGYPAEHKPGHLADNLPYANVHHNTFGE